VAAGGAARVPCGGFEFAIPLPEIGADRLASLPEHLANFGGLRCRVAGGLGEIEPQVWKAMQDCDALMIDGTCWRADELIALGVSRKRAQDMGHLPLDGPGGMLDWLDRLPHTTRKILIHINNTNPILDEDSTEHARVRGAGIELAFDGMEFSL